MVIVDSDFSCINEILALRSNKNAYKEMMSYGLFYHLH